ncbi:TetR/AcrR family transcriptional regulator [Actinomadura scrupuli]|uniref:TetR/AcrR family transcriptional regulator n=1 Tax=Actinomadura scrupuli TaxID=559629 RepID=UPI003D9903C1
MTDAHDRPPTTGTLTPYEQAQRHGDETLRTTLLDAASRLLVAEGPQALSMRRIAHEVGCSTTVLYRMFGGKDGLTEGLYIEGFERFRRRLAAVPRHPDPRVHLAELGRAYRDNALLERNYYGLMFDRPIAGFVPSAEAQARARASFAILGEAVSACADAGLLTVGDPAVVAEVLWATAHGLVSLELAGHLPDPDAVFDTAMRVTAAGLLAPTAT